MDRQEAIKILEHSGDYVGLLPSEPRRTKRMLEMPTESTDPDSGTKKEIHVCALCGKKIDQGRIEIVSERSLIIRRMTRGEQLQFDLDMYGKDPDKWVKKKDVIKLLIRKGSINKSALIEEIKDM